MRLRSLLAPLALLLALPAHAFAIEQKAGVGGTDRTMDIMLGLIVFLLIAMVVIGVIEQRRPH